MSVKYTVTIIVFKYISRKNTYQNILQLYLFMKPLMIHIGVKEKTHDVSKQVK